MSKIVVILGANGALGRSVSRKFTDPSWTRLLCDISEPIDKECQFVALPRGASAKDQYAVLQKAVAGLTHGNGVVDAIVNVGGGFQMDSASVCQEFILIHVFSLTGYSSHCKPCTLHRLNLQCWLLTWRRSSWTRMVCSSYQVRPGQLDQRRGQLPMVR